MRKEEDMLNTLLWKYYTDDELKKIAQKIIVHIPLELEDKYSSWMMAGMNNAEIIYWLKTVKNGAPCFVLEKLLAIAMNELSPERWQVVRDALLDGRMVA